MGIEDFTSEQRSFVGLFGSFQVGMVRLRESEYAYLHMSLAFLHSRALNNGGLDEPASRVLKDLDAVKDTYDSLDYVMTVSRLVYAASLLDTLLSDTTTFLFLMFPASMGKNHHITVDTLLDATSRNDAITRAAKNRAREISYLPFVGRIEFLRKTFGLKFDFDEKTTEDLNRYSEMRNVAVHDQGFIGVFLDDQGKVDVKFKSSPKGPTEIDRDNLLGAVGLFYRVGCRIAEMVFTQTLRLPLSEIVQMVATDLPRSSVDVSSRTHSETQ